MFEKFAELAKIRRLERRRAVSPLAASMHSNDNLPGFRRPADGLRPCPKPALPCHWYLIDGGLKARWKIEKPDDGPTRAFNSQPAMDRVSGPSLLRVRRKARIRCPGPDVRIPLRADLRRRLQPTTPA
jgi:hypothetical protein